jgi:hypothetical protein
VLQRVLVCTIGLALMVSVSASAQVRVVDQSPVGNPPLVTIDILPERCPNRVDIIPDANLFSVTTARATNNGIPVAIVGSASFNVRTVDPLSLSLEGVAPKSYRYKDVTTADVPLEGGCDCFVSGPDGIEDLLLEFDRDEVVAALQPINNGAARSVGLSLATKSGVVMQGWDCMIIRTMPPSRHLAGITPKEPAAAFNYPNPFNAGTVISYEVGAEQHVRLEIYDLLGRSVTTLVNGTQAEGLYQEAWDGTDRNGTPVSSGMYFFRLVQGQNVQTHKMVLMK